MAERRSHASRGSAVSVEQREGRPAGKQDAVDDRYLRATNSLVRLTVHAPILRRMRADDQARLANSGRNVIDVTLAAA